MHNPKHCNLVCITELFSYKMKCLYVSKTKQKQTISRFSCLPKPQELRKQPCLTPPPHLVGSSHRKKERASIKEVKMNLNLPLLLMSIANFTWFSFCFISGSVKCCGCFVFILCTGNLVDCNAKS